MSMNDELYLKEQGDAKRKAERYGLPFAVFRGTVIFNDGRLRRPANEVEQMLWDALP